MSFRFHKFSRNRVDNWTAHLQRRVDEDLARVAGNSSCQPRSPSRRRYDRDDHRSRSPSRDYDRDPRERYPESPNYDRRPPKLDSPRHRRRSPPPGSPRQDRRAFRPDSPRSDRFSRQKGQSSPRRDYRSSYSPPHRGHDPTYRTRYRGEDSDGDIDMKGHSPSTESHSSRYPLRPEAGNARSSRSSISNSTHDGYSKLSGNNSPLPPPLYRAPLNARKNSVTNTQSGRNSSPSYSPYDRPPSKEVINLALSSSDAEDAAPAARPNAAPALPPPTSIAQVAKMSRRDFNNEEAAKLAAQKKRLQKMVGSNKVLKHVQKPVGTKSLQPQPHRPAKNGQSNIPAVGSSRLPLPTLSGSSKAFSPPQSTIPLPPSAKLVKPVEKFRPANFPSWYLHSRPSVKLKPGQRDGESILFRLRNLIENTIEASLPSNRRSRGFDTSFDELRNYLHKLPFVRVDAAIIRRTSALDRLAAIFNEDQMVSFINKSNLKGKYPECQNPKDCLPDIPFDIQSDAFELFIKWSDEDFSTDLLRHLVFPVKTPAAASVADDGQGGGVSLDPKYIKNKCDYYGSGRLVNGQWFARQLAALRDGAHGATQAGIHGAKDRGAFSIVLSAGKYEDHDDGDVIKYSGTIASTKLLEKSGGSSSEVTTEATQRLKESMKSRRPVRVIRSENLDSKYAPKQGFRYDGEYVVVASEEKLVPAPPSILPPTSGGSGGNGKKGSSSTTSLDDDPSSGLVTVTIFTLLRRPNQDPIRYKGPEQRPTKEEMDKYAEEVKLLNRKGSAL